MNKFKELIEELNSNYQGRTTIEEEREMIKAVEELLEEMIAFSYERDE